MHLFLTEQVIDARREARMLHEVCAMTNGDKRDAAVMRSHAITTGALSSHRPLRRAHFEALASIGL